MSVACVDINSPVFKNKAKELGISEGQLENILHEYNNSSILQSQFTEDQYIESKLNGLPNTQASDVMVEAWEKAYSEPKTFDSIEDFNRVKIQAISIFGEQSVGHRETVDGKHVLTVAEPFNVEAYQKEIDSIKEKAIADGTFRKVHNPETGKLVDSNLNEQQWLQVRTKAFKRWFGDWENDSTNASKVVDENGEPLVVYHGSKDFGFSVFNKSDDGKSYFFTDELGTAESYVPTYNKEVLSVLADLGFFSSSAIVPKNVLIQALNDFYKDSDYKRKLLAELNSLKETTSKVIDYDAESERYISYRNQLLEKYKDTPKNQIPGYKPDLDGVWYIDYEKEDVINDLARSNAESWDHIYKDVTGINFSDYHVKDKSESIYKVFLNIKNPKEVNAYGSNWNRIHDSGTANTTRQIHSKALDAGYDGTIIRNVRDIGGHHDEYSSSFTTKEIYAGDHYDEWRSIDHANLYVASQSNQIKSATGNRGTFSTRNNDIYFNRQVVPLAQRLNDANIIHKLNGKYYLSIKGEENGVQRRKQELQEFLDNNGYKDVVVDYISTGRAVEVTFNTPSEHNDLIAREVNRSMSSIKNVMSFLEEKVPAIKGHIHYNTTVEEAGKLLGRALLPEETSFVRGNQIYLIKGRATREGSIEEVLHVITNTLLMDNRSLASSLLREAKQLFPQLASEIDQGYKDYGKRERNLELLTQALSRVFRQEYDATKPNERVKVENFLRKFIDWIRNLFGFRENPQTGNKIIELDKLPKVMSLKDFATLINSADGEFSTGEQDIVQFNRYKIEEQDRPYITESMVVAGTSKNVTGVSELMKEIENLNNMQGPWVPVSVPYSSWKSLDMPYETPSAKTLLGNLAVMANDWNGERFDYNKKDKTISVPKYWYEVAKLLSKNRDIIKALDELDRLSPEDFADNMSDSDFKIIDSYFSNGDYGTLELLFSSESDLEAFVNAGMISFSYTDSRQGSLFDTAGNPIEKESIQKQQATQQQYSTLEVSTAGDSFGRQFSAFNARFKQGTIIDGVDVSGRSIEDVYQNVIKQSGKNMPPATFSRLQTLYRGYATKTEAKARDLDETVGNTAADYVEGIVGFIPKYHFTSSREEAEGYASTRTDKSEEEFIRDGKIVRQQNRHYTGDFAQVGSYYISKDAKVVTFEDLHDLNRNPQRAENADIIVLKRGTLDQRASEFIVREGGKHLIKELSEVSKNAQEEYSYQEGYFPLWQEWARQNPELIEQLRERAEGKTLTDRFAHGAVSQARALTEILTQQQEPQQREQEPQTIQPIRKENRPFFLRQRLLSQKIDALNENEVGLTTSEIDSEATMLVDWISDQITEIQQHPEKYYELFGKPKSNDWASEEDRKKDIDSVKSMSRRSIISNIGISTLIDAYRTSIFEDNAAIDDLSGRDYSKAMLLKDNLDVLFELGKGVFKNNEGYAIKHNDELNTYETVETTEDNTIAEEVPDDGAEIAEEQGNLEDWMLDKTTIEVLNGASALIRSALGKLYILDENGQPVTDYLGRRQRVSQNDAVKSIIRWIQGSRNVDDMMHKLEEKAKNNTWLNPLITRLNDRSGNETAFISQFNTVFDKHFRLFDVIKKQKGSNGKNYALEVNSHPAVTDAMNYITAMQSIGEAPLFTTRGINSNNLAQWEATTSRLEANANVTEEQFNKYKDGYVARLFNLATLLGYPITKETIQKSLNFNNFNQAITAARNILDNLKAEVKNPDYSPYTYVENGHYISGYVRNLIEVLVDSVEDTTENSFYENGKMRQSNLIPSYASKLFQKLTSDKDSFDKVMAEEFGKYEWFYDKTMGWRLPVLQDLAKMDESTRKKVLVHKVNLNFQGEQYMRGLSAERYILSVLTEFASGENARDDGSIKTAFYGFPMQSNKASSDFLSLFRYTGDLAKAQITSKMLMVFGQELSRIQTVRKRDRKEGDIDYIEGFDKRGKDFCLLDFFNDPTKLVRKDGKITAEEANELHSLIEDKVAGKKVNNERLESLARKAIEENFDQRYEQFHNQCVNFGLMDSIRNIEGVIAKVSKYPPQKQVDDFIENFVWNDALAKINIIELLVTDPAYYKNDDDFQKRFAQVHSPGTRGYADATDFYGNSVSDRYMRAVILKDGIIDGKALKNNIIENLSIILDRDIEKASADTKEAAIAVKESILGRMEGINVSDGQAFSGLTATRKKGFLFGNWTREAEKVYNKIRNGQYNISDLETAFNVKKPFVYTQLSQDVHTEGTPLQTLKVPTQFKDSEYLLIMAAALMEGKETGKPNLLKVLYDVAEESAYDITDAGETYNGKGIDIFVFESGVKSGLSGASDITTKWVNGEYEGKTVEQMEESLKQQLLDFIYIRDEKGNKAYNDVTVKAIPVEDYAIQNEVPLHMRDHTQIWGSQMRSILESNLLYSDFEGNPVTFTFTDSKGETHTLNREAFIKAYEDASRAVSDEAVASIRKELGLNNENPIDTKVAIAKVLQNEISSNPGRYGNDLLLACTIDEYGNFRIPPGDPIQSKRIEQLVNSIVKNRLNKPKVPGGLGVQVSNFGTSRRLNIRFFMKDGKTLLPTRDEWLAKNPDKTADDYTKFCKENQGGYAYEENYAPAHTRAFFDLFTDRNGNIDLEAIEMLDDTLLYSIDQRTPTEFYYSVSVAKIVGFMPKEAGDGFMRPYEITEKDDSDFDVDKETKWKKSFKIKRNKERVTNKQLREAVPQLENTQLTEDEKQAVIDMVENRLSWSGLDESRYEKEREKQIKKELEKARQKKINTIVSDFRTSDIFSSSADKPAIWKALKQAYIKLQFSVEYPSEGAQAAMNDAWEMSRAVMQHESNASKIMSPGGPDAVTRRGYIIGALKTGRYTEEQLNAMSTKELGDIAKSSNMNLVWFTNQVEYYKRNNDASSNLGIFAVANTAHNILEGQGYGVMNDEAFSIAGKYFGEEVILDDTVDNNGISISKTLGGNVGAAADAAKTPSHAFMNVNGNTINEFLFLLRAGLNLDDATLFIASKPIEDLVQRFNAENVSGYKPMDALLEETLQGIADAADIKEDSRVYQEELTHKELVDLVSGKGTIEESFKALLMFKRIRSLTEGMRALTFATRYNSVASAVGPQIVDNLIHEHTVNSYADTKNSNTIQRNFRYKYTKEDNREVKFGDKIEDNNGDTVILTPDNVEDLQEQGIISIIKSYKKVSLGDILRAHPMLSGFAQGYSLANEIFTILRMPANSAGFKSVLNADKTVSDFLYKDKKILSAFSDFYQSYLLVAGDVISTKNEKSDGPLYYMRKFPSDFLKVKGRYTGNALIDAIVPEVRDGVISLKVRTTGIKAEDRAKLQAAWNQLYKQNQKLAIDLFKYNFWRGGIGFSPKTFMNLLPIQMKERIDGYADTYRNFPDVETSCVIDQFFLNNVSNNKIVRNVDSIKEASFADNVYTFTGAQHETFKSLPFFRWKDSEGQYHVFKQTFRNDKFKTVKFVEVEALGNGGEFLEMSANAIVKPIIRSTEFEESDFISDTESSAQPSTVQPVQRSDAQIQAEIEDVLNYLKDSEGNYLEGINVEKLKDRLYKIKSGQETPTEMNLNIWKNSLKERFEENGIEYSDSEIDKIVKKFC